MTTSPFLIKLARQGDAAAITALMNAALRLQAVRVKTRLQGDCLQVMLRSPNELHPHAAIAFIRRGLLRLQAESIHSVRAYAWHQDPDFPVWIAEFDVSPVESPAQVQAVPTIQTPEPPNLEQSSFNQRSAQTCDQPVVSQQKPLTRDRAAPQQERFGVKIQPDSPETTAFLPAVTPTEPLPRSPIAASKPRSLRFSWGVFVVFAVVVYWMVAIIPSERL